VRNHHEKFRSTSPNFKGFAAQSSALLSINATRQNEAKLTTLREVFVWLIGDRGCRGYIAISRANKIDRCANVQHGEIF